MSSQADVGEGNVRIPLSRHRRAVAASMVLSARVPQFCLYKHVDMAALKSLRESSPQPPFSYSDAITASCARALRAHRDVNASFDEEAECIIEYGEVNIGLAVAGSNGLVVVVIHDADRRTLPELASERQRLTHAANTGSLRGRDVLGATFVISNLGPAGIPMFQALLVPPLAAILAVGAIRIETAMVGSQPASTSVSTICLTVDHRVLDGWVGSTFLNAVAEGLEDPGWMTV